MFPYSKNQMMTWGYVAWRQLPNEIILAVSPMLFNNGRLFWDINENGYEDFFCYDTLEMAIESMNNFNPIIEKEPNGWKRHFSTGRRRPNGDVTKEFINF